MLSSDREILISIKEEIRVLNERVTVLDGTVGELRQDISEMRQEQRMLRHDIDNLQTSVYWILAAIGIFIAFVSVVPTLASRKSEASRDDKVQLSLSQFGELITAKVLSTERSQRKDK